MKRVIFAIVNTILASVIAFSMAKDLEMNNKERLLTGGIAFVALALLDIFERVSQIESHLRKKP